MSEMSARRINRWTYENYVAFEPDNSEVSTCWECGSRWMVDGHCDNCMPVTDDCDICGEPLAPLDREEDPWTTSHAACGDFAEVAA